MFFLQTDIESKLQDLPKEEKKTNLLLAAFTLINSLASVSHIFTASIAMMEGAKDPASLSKIRKRAVSKIYPMDFQSALQVY